jgi:hypothetical protein
VPTSVIHKYGGGESCCGPRKRPADFSVKVKKEKGGDADEPAKKKRKKCRPCC